MKKITVLYPNIANMGDLLNIYIFEKLFGYKAVISTPMRCKMYGIGSGLGLLNQSPSNFANHIAQHISGVLFPTVYIWGTGFLKDSENIPFFRKNVKFCALRGLLSKNKVEKIMGDELGSIPLCDGGILASKLLDEIPPKKYALGIIPHFRHFKQHYSETFKILESKFMESKYSESVIIDVREHPLKVVSDIASCETIVSSSLHGLIVADSFHIPCIHLKITKDIKGDGFKFDDYYSCYGIEHFSIDESVDINPKYIKDKYAIDPEVVESKKEQMIQAFPF